MAPRQRGPVWCFGTELFFEAVSGHYYHPTAPGWPDIECVHKGDDPDQYRVRLIHVEDEHSLLFNTPEEAAAAYLYLSGQGDLLPALLAGRPTGQIGTVSAWVVGQVRIPIGREAFEGSWPVLRVNDDPHASRYRADGVTSTFYRIGLGYTEELALDDYWQVCRQTLDEELLEAQRAALFELELVRDLSRARLHVGRQP